MSAAIPRDWISPGRTALLVIDMQVDFAAPEGALGRSGVDLGAVAPALAAAEGLAAAARACGAPVVFVGLRTTPQGDSPVWREWVRRRGDDPDSAGALCREGSAGAAFVGPTPAPGEAVVLKPRYSGFFGADLDARLRALGVDTLVVCGLTTECCVDATARDAFQRDYHVFVARDACAAYDLALHEAALRGLALNCAIVAGVGDIVEAWTPDADRLQRT